MIRRPALLLALALLLAATLCACVGTETGNSFAGNLGLSLSDAPVISPQPKVEEGWLGFGELAFVPTAECATPADAPLALDGPAATDLAGTAPLPLSLEAGEFCGVRLVLAPATTPLPAAAPPTLEGLTLWLRGTDPDGVPFLIASAAPLEVLLQAPESGAFAIAEAEAPVLLELDFALAMRGLSLSSATPEADGSVRVDAEHNPELLAAVEANLPGALALYRDLDADGSVDQDERAAGPLASAP